MSMYERTKGKKLIARESFQSQGERIQKGQILSFEIQDYCVKFENGKAIYEERAFVYADLMEGFFLSNEELGKCDFV